MSIKEPTHDVVQEPEAFRTDVETMAEECTAFVEATVESAGVEYEELYCHAEHKRNVPPTPGTSFS